MKLLFLSQWFTINMKLSTSLAIYVLHIHTFILSVFYVLLAITTWGQLCCCISWGPPGRRKRLPQLSPLSWSVYSRHHRCYLWAEHGVMSPRSEGIIPRHFLAGGQGLSHAYKCRCRQRKKVMIWMTDVISFRWRILKVIVFSINNDFNPEI